MLCVAFTGCRTAFPEGVRVYEGIVRVLLLLQNTIVLHYKIIATRWMECITTR